MIQNGRQFFCCQGVQALREKSANLLLMSPSPEGVKRFAIVSCRNTICAKSIYETMSLNSATTTTTTPPVEATTDHLGAPAAATGAGAPATCVVESPAAEAAVYSRSLGAAQPSGDQPLDQRPIGPPGESTTIEVPRGVPSGRCIQPGLDYELSCI